MALTSRALFLYGFQIDSTNFAIDFKNSGVGSEIQASIPFGFYSLTGLLTAIASAMNTADPTNTYTATADRTYSGGTQNRVTIATNGAHLDLLFATGTRAASSVCLLIGFTATDKTGATTYTGSSTAGTAVETANPLYTYTDPTMEKKLFGNVNISASGKKEAIVFDIQKFFQFMIKYEPQAKVMTDWVGFFEWAIEQKRFDFTPQVASPSTVYDVTLESTQEDSKGLGYKWTEMLSEGWVFYYSSGTVKLRQTNL